MTLKERLEAYIRGKRCCISSGAIQKLVAERTHYTAQNVGRRLRELENEGVLEVQYRKNHAWYRAVTRESIEELMARQIQWFDGLPEAAT